MAVCGRQKSTTAHPRVMTVGCSTCSWVPCIRRQVQSHCTFELPCMQPANVCAPVLITFRLCVSCLCLCKLISLLISSLSVLQEGLGFHHMWVFSSAMDVIDVMDLYMRSRAKVRSYLFSKPRFPLHNNTQSKTHLRPDPVVSINSRFYPKSKGFANA